MFQDDTGLDVSEHFEISIRFRHMIEQRIARLELDAARDELALEILDNEEHIRRHMRLVAAQREEADRMRRFLGNSSNRSTVP